MKLLKVLFVVFMAIAALTIFGKVRQRMAANTGPSSAGLSAAGFFLLSKDDARNTKVTIMSPPNCPSHEAQRARALGEALARAGIPHEMKSEIAFNFTDPAEAARVQKYMANVANPLVLVRGRAKGNPTFDEVVAEYRAAKQ